jgi:hypothetical protein
MQRSCAIFLSVASPAVHYLSTLSHKRNDYWKKWFNIKCVSIFSRIFSTTFLILRRTERDMIKNIYWSTGITPFIPVRFYWNLNILDRLLQNPQISNFIKIRTVGHQLFHVNRRTEMHDEANSHFSQLG